MGSWGTGIFEDDLALDLRGTYRELLSLKLADEAILAELQQQWGGGEDIQESTFWIALALEQHQFGRLDEGVRKKALDFIESGRALQHWTDLTDEGDRSIASRAKQLAKAKLKILSPQAKKRSPRPDKDLLDRIDRTYPAYPWKQDGLYAYRLETGEYVVLYISRLYAMALRQHYARQGKGFVRVKHPEVWQPLYVVLDYRQPRLPTETEAMAAQPFVRPIPSDVGYREARLPQFREFHEDYAAKALQTFEVFEQAERARCARKTDEEFLAHYHWSMDWYRRRRDRYADGEHALRRQFYLSLDINFREIVPEERIIDLGWMRQIDCDSRGINATWSTLDEHLVHKKPLSGNECSYPW